MSHDDAPVDKVPADAPNEPAVPTRREAVREKAEQVRVRQSRVRWIRRGALGVALVAACAVAISAVYWTVDSALSAPELAPSNSTPDRGFAITSVSGAAGALTAADEQPAASEETASDGATPAPTETAAPPVEIDVYVDYLSTGAKQWQVANSAQLSSWVQDGAVTLTYYPVSMLTAKSNGTKYSLRAAAAAACVASFSPDQFFAFNEQLLQRQPTVDAPGFSDEDLADLAQATGVEKVKRVRGCVEDGSYQSWVRQATEEAVTEIPGTDGLSLTGSPTVLVNGEKYAGALDDAAEFSQFVLTSASGKFYQSKLQTPTPTPTPTPTATPTP